jgi:hypothetical protein
VSCPLALSSVVGRSNHPGPSTGGTGPDAFTSSLARLLTRPSKYPKVRRTAYRDLPERDFKFARRGNPQRIWRPTSSRITAWPTSECGWLARRGPPTPHPVAVQPLRPGAGDQDHEVQDARAFHCRLSPTPHRQTVAVSANQPPDRYPAPRHRHGSARTRRLCAPSSACRTAFNRRAAGAPKEPIMSSLGLSFSRC